MFCAGLSGRRAAAWPGLRGHQEARPVPCVAAGCAETPPPDHGEAEGLGIPAADQTAGEQSPEPARPAARAPASGPSASAVAEPGPSLGSQRGWLCRGAGRRSEQPCHRA